MILIKTIIFILLLAGLTGLFYSLRKSRILNKKIKEAYETIDLAVHQRARGYKKRLLHQENKKNIFEKLEYRFLYSGLGRQIPFLSTELWMLFKLLTGIAIYFLIIFISGKWLLAATAVTGYLFIIHFIESLLIHKNYKAVDENLLEFLNLLGNYSMTAGEVTGVFRKVSIYMKEPLKSALEECSYEAQTSGDTNVALLTLADKIEHPKFKEIIRGMEICTRYSADFSILVSSNRKVLQDYMRAKKERKSLAQESVMNMFVLLAMLVVVLIVADQMLSLSIWNLLLHTTVGHIGVGVIALILLIFYWQIASSEK